jgi:hypothetical protein
MEGKALLAHQEAQAHQVRPEAQVLQERWALMAHEARLDPPDHQGHLVHRGCRARQVLLPIKDLTLTNLSPEVHTLRKKSKLLTSLALTEPPKHSTPG